MLRGGVLLVALWVGGGVGVVFGVRMDVWVCACG